MYLHLNYQILTNYLYWTSQGEVIIWSVGGGLAVDPGLHPVVGQDLALGQVDVHGEEAVVLAVVDVPLLPGHVPSACHWWMVSHVTLILTCNWLVSPTLPRVHVQPV